MTPAISGYSLLSSLSRHYIGIIYFFQTMTKFWISIEIQFWHLQSIIMKPGPGKIVEIAILPGIYKSLGFNRNRSRHHLMFIKMPGPGNIIKPAILPGVDESLDLKRIYFLASPEDRYLAVSRQNSANGYFTGN